MAKVAAAQARLFKNIFICRQCKSKMRADGRKVLIGRVKCRKCGGTAFKPKRKK